MANELTNEEIKRTVAAWRKTGSHRGAARERGIGKSSVQRHLAAAADRGLLDPNEWTNPVPPGFHVRGVSSLTDDEGNVKAQWTIARKDNEQREDIVAAMRDAFRDLEPAEPAPISPTAGYGSKDLLGVIPIADLHIGMYAWAAETGANYDTRIARRLLLGAVSDLLARMPLADTVAILNLGDFFHIDDDSARTRKSGNPLDMDTRFAEVIRIGVDLTIATIQKALERHKTVIYRALPGNHDEYAKIGLEIAVAKYFENEPRVIVDMDPSRFFVYEFGRVMLAATHGDMVKAEQMPGVMAGKWPEIWGRTQHRHALLGHQHKSKRGPRSDENFGATWEIFETVAAKDAWNAAMAHLSGRALTAIVYHRDDGEWMRIARPVKPTED